MRTLRIGLLVGLLGLSAACGAESDADHGGSAESFAGEEVALMIKAAEGGEVSVGVAALTIPKGALAADTEISVKVESKKGRPDEEHVLLDVYDFGPDGTTFSQPVTLAFDVSKVNMPEGGTPMIAWQNGDKWETLPTVIANGKATAPTTHFTPFTLVFVLNDDGEVVQAGGQCGDDFDACGGNIVGTWTYTGACLTLPPGALGGTDSGDNPFAACSEQPHADFTIDVTGTATFGADGSFNVDQTVTSGGGFYVPQSCLDELMPGLTCDALEAPVSEDGKGCLLSDDGDSMPQMDMETGTYTTEGSTLKVMSEGDTEEDDSVTTYCVQGDKLTVHFANADGTVVQYEATRN
jgi:hypothetical protein